jgi:hypothetical protein
VIDQKTGGIVIPQRVEEEGRMKKVLVSFMAMSLVLFAMAANVSADWYEPYCPSCQTEFWDTKTDSNWFNTLGESKTWTFNLDTDALTPGGANIDPGDIINKAALRIKFTDDNDPSNAPFEYAKLILDGSTYYSDFEVDEGWLSNINVVTKFSPSDHILAVTITQNSGDFGVDKLEIHGCYTAVPEPMSLMLLGLGLLGIGVARRKN